MNNEQTHDCGCNIRYDVWQPCPQGWLLWTFAAQKYSEAVEVGDWQPYLEARWMLCNHYGFKPQDADAYYVNMERRYRKLALADQYQLERWIENEDADLKPHALVEWGLRFGLDYPDS